MKKAWILLVLALFVGTPLFAGVVYELETKDHRTAQPQVEKARASIEGDNLKMETGINAEGQPKNTMIFLGGKKEMLVVDHERKEYTVIDEAAVEALSDQMKDLKSQVDEALAQVPEEQRAMVEQMLKGRMEAATPPEKKPSVVAKTDRRDTVGGTPCVVYEVTRENLKLRELCVADFDKIAGSREAYAAFKQVGAFFSELFESAQESFGGMFSGGAFSLEDNPFDSFAKIDGFPVTAKEFDNGKVVGEMTFQSATPKNLGPTDFTPPADYRKQMMPVQ